MAQTGALPDEQQISCSVQRSQSRASGPSGTSRGGCTSAEQGDSSAQSVVSHSRVPHRRLNTGVAHEPLDLVHRHSTLQQVRAERRAELVRMAADARSPL